MYTNWFTFVPACLTIDKIGLKQKKGDGIEKNDERQIQDSNLLVPWTSRLLFRFLWNCSCFPCMKSKWFIWILAWQNEKIDTLNFAFHCSLNMRLNFQIHSHPPPPPYNFKFNKNYIFGLHLMSVFEWHIICLVSLRSEIFHCFEWWRHNSDKWLTCIQNCPNAPNLVVIGSEMTEIWGFQPPHVCVNFFYPMWNRVKRIKWTQRILQSLLD